MRIFISYARRDRRVDANVEKICDALKRCHAVWLDDELVSGRALHPSIMLELMNADLVIALLSNNFINSEYCMDVEMEAAKARWLHGDANVLPVILDNCDWSRFWFGRIVAFPSSGIAIRDIDESDWVSDLVARSKNIESAFLFSIDDSTVRPVARGSEFLEEHLNDLLTRLHREAVVTTNKEGVVIHIRPETINHTIRAFDFSIYKGGLIRERRSWKIDLSDRLSLVAWDDVREIKIEYGVAFCELHQSIILQLDQRSEGKTCMRSWLPSGFCRRFSNGLANALQD